MRSVCPTPSAHIAARIVALGASLLLVACGGGGGEAGSPKFGPEPAPSPSPQPPLSLQPSSSYAQQCAPENSLAPLASRVGSLSVEKQWMRSYFDEAYLWRDEVPQVDANAASYSNTGNVQASLEAYFNALLTPARTASGAQRDRFSFTIPTAKWDQETKAGVDAGFGIEWTMGSPTPPRQIRIASVAANSPASRAGLMRGDTLLSVNGVSADSNDSSGLVTLNDALSPDAVGKSYVFAFARGDANGLGQTITTSLLSAEVEKIPVPLTQVLTGADGKQVGYMVFNDHIAKGEAQLIAAINSFQQAGVADLVVDLRYNGGGLLFMASELAYMVAGPAQTSNKIFETSSYNSRRQADNSSSPFYSSSCILDANFNCTLTQPLPSLGLKRVYVLAQSGTCSASEAFINGLRGIDVQVILIGGKTCGKPYGFTPKDNCGMSYFPIEFGGVNNKGFGDYADGFVPAGSGATGVPGCVVADDLGNALGAPQEAMLAAALQHRISGSCPPQLAKGLGAKRAGEGGVPLELKRSPVRSNAFHLPR